MLSGRRAFTRASAVETLAAIIQEEPVGLGSLRPGLPDPLLGLIAICLAKRPEDRFVLRARLAQALEELGPASAVEPRAREEIQAPPLPLLRARRIPYRTLVAGLALAAVVLVAGRDEVPRCSARRIQSLAVLPFENPSSDPNTEYLSHGLTESLIDKLSGPSSLRVMARSTVLRFKGTDDPQEAGRRLGVGAVLTGTVARRGSHRDLGGAGRDCDGRAPLGQPLRPPAGGPDPVQDGLAPTSPRACGCGSRARRAGPDPPRHREPDGL